MVLSKRTAVAVCGFLAAVTLTGCVDVTGDVDIDSDAKVSGVVIISQNKQISQFAGISSPDQFKEWVEPDAAGPLSVESCTAADEGNTYTLTCDLDAATFTDTSGSGTWWSATKTDAGAVEFHFVNQGDKDMSANAAANPGFQQGMIQLNVGFPGTITEVEGDGVTAEVGGRTAEISIGLVEPADVTVVSEAPAGGLSDIGETPALPVLLVLFVVVIIGGGAFMFLRTNGKPATPVDEQNVDSGETDDLDDSSTEDGSDDRQPEESEEDAPVDDLIADPETPADEVVGDSSNEDTEEEPFDEWRRSLDS